MPIVNHFRPPTNEPSWSTFHGGWVGQLAMQLNETVLAGRYLAANNTHLSGGYEIDIGTREKSPPNSAGTNGHSGGIATATLPLAQTWTVPAVDRTIPTSFPDEFSVQITDRQTGEVVGAIEFVSPANKDRPEKREAFVGKCATIIRRGIGLIIVDLITSRRRNLHGELLELLGEDPGTFSEEFSLYSTAYHPYRCEREDEGEEDMIDVWERGLNVGDMLPTMPLCLRGGPCVPIDLSTSYERLLRGYLMV